MIIKVSHRKKRVSGSSSLSPEGPAAPFCIFEFFEFASTSFGSPGVGVSGNDGLTSERAGVSFGPALLFPVKKKDNYYTTFRQALVPPAIQ